MFSKTVLKNSFQKTGTKQSLTFHILNRSFIFPTMVRSSNTKQSKTTITDFPYFFSPFRIIILNHMKMLPPFVGEVLSLSLKLKKRSPLSTTIKLFLNVLERYGGRSPAFSLLLRMVFPPPRHVNNLQNPGQCWKLVTKI